MKAELTGGERSLIALRADDQGNSLVLSICLRQDEKPVLIWKIQP
ncbi:MAG TPA: hypothetical protein VII93_10640 [Anaerolineales bacterium]